SNLAEKARGKTPPRGPYAKADDDVLLPLIRGFVDERPTYGSRRIAALVNRKRAQQGLPPANRKRVHRIMQRQGLLLERHTARRQGRAHDGKIMVMRSNLRCCVPTAWSFPAGTATSSGWRSSSTLSTARSSPGPPSAAPGSAART